MGVSGDLLGRILRTAGRDVEFRKYIKGREDGKKRKLRPLRVALDVSAWIARAAHGHGSMLVDDRHLSNYGRAQIYQEINDQGDEIPSILTSKINRDNYVRTCAQYVLNRIQEWKSSTKTEMLIVLDGNTPPVKHKEVHARAKKRKDAEKKRDATRDQRNEARLRAGKRAGAGILHGAIVTEVIMALRQKEIPFLIAPYEADGQLAYLAKQGIVDVVVTEDSDLISYGIEMLLYKGGNKLVRRCDLGAMELVPKSLSLVDFSDEMLAVLFVSMGCDYCESLPGIGSVTARNVVRAAFGQSEEPVLQKVIALLFSSAHSKPKIESEEFKKQFEDNFLSALFLYRHPLVFCPLKGKCVMMNCPAPEYDPALIAYGPYADICKDKAKQVEIQGEVPPEEIQIMLAEGWLDSRTMQPYDSLQLPAHEARIWEGYQTKVDLQEGPEDCTDPGEDEDADNKAERGSKPQPATQDGDVEMQPATQEATDSKEDLPATQAEEEVENGGPSTQAGDSTTEGKQPASQDSGEHTPLKNTHTNAGDDDSEATKAFPTPFGSPAKSSVSEVATVDLSREHVLIATASPLIRTTQTSSSSSNKAATQPTQAREGSHISASVASPNLSPMGPNRGGL